MHDVLVKDLGRAVYYGIYDLSANAGWVSVGMDHDTPALAVQTIRRWWHDPKGIAVTDEKMAEIVICRADFHGVWNDTIKPNDRRSIRAVDS